MAGNEVTFALLLNELRQEDKMVGVWHQHYTGWDEGRGGEGGCGLTLKPLIQLKQVQKEILLEQQWFLHHKLLQQQHSQGAEQHTRTHY